MFTICSSTVLDAIYGAYRILFRNIMPEQEHAEGPRMQASGQTVRRTGTQPGTQEGGQAGTHASKHKTHANAKAGKGMQTRSQARRKAGKQACMLLHVLPTLPLGILEGFP